MAALHFGTRRTCCCCCWCGCSVELPRRGQRKVAKRCCVWLRWKVCYSFCIARTCVRVLLAPTAICHSLSCSLTPALSLSPAHSLALLHSLKISFSLVFRLFGIRFAFSSVDFMNLTLFGCGSLCRRRRRQREARRAWSVAKVAASTWQAAADGLKVAVCVTLPEQILVNKHSAAQQRGCTRKYATKIRPGRTTWRSLLKKNFERTPRAASCFVFYYCSVRIHYRLRVSRFCVGVCGKRKRKMHRKFN